MYIEAIDHDKVTETYVAETDQNKHIVANAFT